MIYCKSCKFYTKIGEYSFGRVWQIALEYIAGGLKCNATHEVLHTHEGPVKKREFCNNRNKHNNCQYYKRKWYKIF